MELCNAQNDHTKWIRAIYSLVEVLKTAILIIDERAYSKFEQLKSLNQSIFQMADKMGLYIRYPKSIDEMEKQLRQFKNLHFTIVHSSLWEDLCKNSNSVQKLIKLLGEITRYICITTGKTRPKWLEELKEQYSRVFFVPWYDIQIALGQRGSLDETHNCRLYMIKKYLLEILMNK